MDFDLMGSDAPLESGPWPAPLAACCRPKFARAEPLS